MTPIPRCQTCRYFRRASQDRRRGQCHGALPTADAEGFAQWPAVYIVDFCAMHTPVQVEYAQATMNASDLPDDFHRLMDAALPKSNHKPYYNSKV